MKKRESVWLYLQTFNHKNLDSTLNHEIYVPQKIPGIQYLFTTHLVEGKVFETTFSNFLLNRLLNLIVFWCYSQLLVFIMCLSVFVAKYRHVKNQSQKAMNCKFAITL